MVTTSIFWTALVLSWVGYLALYLLTRRSYKGRIRSEIAETEEWASKYELLRDCYYNELEAELQLRIAEWWPKPRDADEAFELAERMANMRKMRDAGRIHLPREGAAEPGRVHSGKLRTRR